MTLPRLSAEELLWRCSVEPGANPFGLPLAVAMPDGSMAVALSGVIYALSADEWARAVAMQGQ